jgi:hypothetical protein
MKWPEWIQHILDPTSVAARRRSLLGVPGELPTTPDPGGWDAAVEVSASSPSRTVRQIRRRLRQGNYWRYRRLQADVRWMKRQLVKMGLNPEDWRTYLDD